MHEIKEEHLSRLISAADPADWAGSKPFDWADSVERDAGRKCEKWLSKTRVGRRELLALRNDDSIPTEALFFTIMAWGGMKRNHGRAAWQARGKGLIEAMEWVRKEKPAAKDSYKRFRDLRLAGKIKGVGPAYFTKLIFFLSPDEAAFIMDQWTAKSMNLLFGPFIHLTLGANRGLDTVSDRNEPDTYHQFCERMLSLTELLLCETGTEVERRLFSQSRPKPEHWRHYAKSVWDPTRDNRN